LVFDLTDSESFENMNFWLSDLNKHAPEKIVKVLVGNKCDLCNVGFFFDGRGPA
jgi:GTPase SAR1 family protein